MPFRAIDSDKEKVILSVWFKDSLEVRVKHPNLICPFCKGKLSARGGQSRSVVCHFFHIGERVDCPTEKGNTTEMLHHTLAVADVYSLLETRTAPYGNAVSLELEYQDPRIPERIADIAVVASTGEMIQAHEIQLTKIPVTQLNARTDSYEAAGVEVFWWFGKGCDNDEIKLWSQRRFGHQDLIEFDYSEQTMQLRSDV